jgi:hypothetical protein
MRWDVPVNTRKIRISGFSDRYRRRLDSTLLSMLDSTLVSTLDSTLLSMLDSTLVSTLDSTLVSTLDSTLVSTLVSTIMSTLLSTLVSMLVSTLDSTLVSALMRSLMSRLVLRSILGRFRVALDKRLGMTADFTVSCENPTTTRTFATLSRDLSNMDDKVSLAALATASKDDVMEILESLIGLVFLASWAECDEPTSRPFPLDPPWVNQSGNPIRTTTLWEYRRAHLLDMTTNLLVEISRRVAPGDDWILEFISLASVTGRQVAEKMW